MAKDRWAPYTFSNGKVTKNRVVVPPMASQTADRSGKVTESTLGHYKKLSASGAGLIFVEYSYIDISGKGEPNQLAVDADNKIVGLSQLAKVIQKSGALAALQMVHCGGKSNTELTGGALWGASAIPVPVKNLNLEVPEVLSLEKVQKLISMYIDAAGRAVRAGFDVVEFHAAHGYGLNQWLSPITNHRTDSYGGGIEGRSKILLQIVESIRSHWPNILIAVRLPAQDHFPEGLSLEDMNWVSEQLQKKGVDLLDVSSGLGGWRRQRDKVGQGYLVEDAEQLKQNINLPVIGVGGIEHGNFIDQIVMEGKVDFAAVGRAILSNPHQWGQQNLHT
tara:strand:- start:102618 stop:103619 length:1002 start_codon:yes stop_codon:yes gene_type:complete